MNAQNQNSVVVAHVIGNEKAFIRFSEGLNGLVPVKTTKYTSGKVPFMSANVPPTATGDGPFGQYFLNGKEIPVPGLYLKTFQ